MSSQVQGLIDKIKSEGIQSAQQEANDIKSRAQQEAQSIIQEAEEKAEQIVNEGRVEVDKFKESAQMALKQASRDTILSLRKEIEKSLNDIISQEVGKALSSEDLLKILESVTKSFLDSKKKDVDVQVALSNADQKKLSKGIIAKLQKSLKDKPLKVESSEDISGGFTISFDGGKSSFDFTDKALAQFLSGFLNEQVAAIINNS